MYTYFFNLSVSVYNTACQSILLLVHESTHYIHSTRLSYLVYQKAYAYVELLVLCIIITAVAATLSLAPQVLPTVSVLPQTPINLDAQHRTLKRPTAYPPRTIFLAIFIVILISAPVLASPV